MPATGKPEPSLRWGRAESSRLAWAVVISLVFHLVAYSGYEAGRRLHWWERSYWPAWLPKPQMLTQLFQKKPTPKELVRIEQARREQMQIPLMFVDVNPAKASPEPPKNADYYSDRNSKAANPDPTKDLAKPKIDGKQKEIAKTEDVDRTKAFPLQPTPPPQPAQPPPQKSPPPQPAPPQSKPPPERQPEPSEEAKPKQTLKPGDLAMAKPADTARPGEGKADRPRPAEGQADRPRPRTLAEARARQPKEQQYAGLAGEKMKQDGGVRQHSLESSLNVLATPFGAYDTAIVRAVQNRWYALIDERRFAGARTGKVVLRFHLNSDGTISQMNLLENEVDLTLALLCQSAIRDPSPYEAWPKEMRNMVGADYREITFTFYYR